MQILWGKVLAGEIKSPNSYSLRTLELLRNLSKNDAEVFTKIAKYRIRLSNIYFIPTLESNPYLKTNSLINFDNILHLEEIGLLKTSQVLGIKIADTGDKRRSETFWFGEIALVVYKKEHTPSHVIDGFHFSRAGIELAHLIPVIEEENYITSFANSIKISESNMQFGKPNILENGQMVFIDPKNIE